MPFNIGIGELVLVLIVALLVFGGRLPEVGRSLGRSLLELKKGLQGVTDLATEIGEDLPEEAHPAEEAPTEEKEPGPGS